MNSRKTPEPTERIHVAIVDDDRSTREGLAMLINSTGGLRCAVTFHSIEAALSGACRPSPDVVLVDINLPAMSGVEGAGLLKQKYPGAEIVMLTVYADDEKVFQSICNGACGYLTKDTPPVRLLEAIVEAHHGGAPMSPEIARKVVTLFQKTAQPTKVEEHLAPQEVRLLRLLAEGHSYEAAAHVLNVSVNTIRNYIRSVYAKLHVHTKSEAVSKALRNRIIF
jgi:DNA-binding NarL/FixJ family response regulator